MVILERSHTRIKVDIPRDSGGNLKLAVQVVDSLSNFVTVSYLPPTVTKVISTKYPGLVFPTDCSDCDVVIEGNNFGNVTYNSNNQIIDPKVTIRAVGMTNGFMASIASASNTQIKFKLPPGVGKNVGVYVFTKGQTSAYSVTSSISYVAPTIVSVDPNNVPTSALDANGNKIIVTLTGTNFGGDLLDLTKLMDIFKIQFLPNRNVDVITPGFPTAVSILCSAFISANCLLSVSKDTIKFVLPPNQGKKTIKYFFHILYLIYIYIYIAACHDIFHHGSSIYFSHKYKYCSNIKAVIYIYKYA